jgi:hypothetical protein
MRQECRRTKLYGGDPWIMRTEPKANLDINFVALDKRAVTQRGRDRQYSVTTPAAAACCQSSQRQVEQ